MSRSVYIKWILRDGRQNKYRDFYNFSLMDLVIVAVGPCIWSKTDQATEFLCIVSSAIWTCFISQNTSYIMYSNSLLCSLQIRHGPIKSWQLHFTNADPRRWQSPTQKKVSKYPISILISVSQKPFYVYQVKHDFLQIHNGRAKFWPSKMATIQPSGFWMIIESREIVA